MKPKKYSYQYQGYTLKVTLDDDNESYDFHVAGYENHFGRTRDSIEGIKAHFEKEVDRYLNGETDPPVSLLGQKRSDEEVKFRSRLPIDIRPNGDVYIDISTIDKNNHKTAEDLIEALKKQGIAFIDTKGVSKTEPADPAQKNDNGFKESHAFLDPATGKAEFTPREESFKRVGIFTPGKWDVEWLEKEGDREINIDDRVKLNVPEEHLNGKIARVIGCGVDPDTGKRSCIVMVGGHVTRVLEEEVELMDDQPYQEEE